MMIYNSMKVVIIDMRPIQKLLHRFKRWLSANDYAKLVLFCFVVVSLPVMILGIFSYTKSSGMIQQNVSREKLLNLTQVQSHVEQVLKTVERSSTHFLSSYTLRTAFYETLSQYQFDLYNELKAQINNLQTMDSGIADITILSLDGQWIINNSGLYRLDDWQDKETLLMLMKQSLSSPWLIESTQQGTASESAAAARCPSTVQFIRKLPLTAYEPTGLLKVTIPSCSLSERIALNRDIESIMIFDSDRKLIVNEGRLSSAVIDETRQAVFESSDRALTGQLNLSLESADYTVTYRTSDYNGWVYVSAVTLNELNRQSKEIGWFTLLICLILLVLFICITWIWSRKLYTPILDMYNLIATHTSEKPQDKAVGQVRYIGDQLLRLIFTKSELESKLHRHMGQSKTLFMVRLLQGHLREEDITRNLSAFGVKKQLEGKAFAVLALQIKSLDPERYSSSDQDLLMFAINNMVEEIIPEEKRLYPILFGQSQVTLVISDESSREQFIQELFSIAQHIKDTVRGYLNVEVCLGISNPFGLWKDTPHAYEEGLEALRYGIRLQEEDTLFFGDLGEDHGLHYAFPFSLEEELIDAIKQVDKDRVNHSLRRFLEVTFPSQAGGTNSYSFALIRLLIDLLGLMQSLGIKAVRSEGEEQQSLFDQLFHLKSVPEGEAWFHETIIDPMMSHITDRTESRHQLITKRMVQMIHDEFETDLSIETCAERLHYNSNYLNTLFRKEMDVPFGAYLAQYRHQMAKTWLIETSMTVKEISERLRYNNSQNFIRSFRKLEGITPGKFKEQHSLSEESS
jgi:AraC-like DNA-binding protein